MKINISFFSRIELCLGKLRLPTPNGTYSSQEIERISQFFFLFFGSIPLLAGPKEKKKEMINKLILTKIEISFFFFDSFFFFKKKVGGSK